MMKKELLYVIFSIILLTLACKNEINHKETKVTGKPGIYFKTTEYSFDTLEYKQLAVYKFKFKNNGDQPLIINKVYTSCGCTASEYSKKPYVSNEKGSIKIQYNTKISGKFLKTISVYTNADNKPVELTIKGFVKKSNQGS